MVNIDGSARGFIQALERVGKRTGLVDIAIPDCPPFPGSTVITAATKDVVFTENNGLAVEQQNGKFLFLPGGSWAAISDHV